MASTFTSVMSFVSGQVMSNDQINFSVFLFQFALLDDAVGHLGKRQSFGVVLLTLAWGHELGLFGFLIVMLFTFGTNAAGQRTDGEDGD